MTCCDKYILAKGFVVISNISKWRCFHVLWLAVLKCLWNIGRDIVRSFDAFAQLFLVWFLFYSSVLFFILVPGWATEIFVDDCVHWLLKCVFIDTPERIAVALLFRNFVRQQDIFCSVFAILTSPFRRCLACASRSLARPMLVMKWLLLKFKIYLGSFVFKVQWDHFVLVCSYFCYKFIYFLYFDIYRRDRLHLKFKTIHFALYSFKMYISATHTMTHTL